MSQQMRADLAGITELVNAGNISEEQKGAAVWCIKKLPDLYDQFCQTYERRYVDEIVRLEKAMFLRVAGTSPVSSQAQGMVDTITARLEVLHERVGLPLLNTKPVPASRSPKVR
jgi:hypothetical protein